LSLAHADYVRSTPQRVSFDGLHDISTNELIIKLNIAKLYMSIKSHSNTHAV